MENSKIECQGEIKLLRRQVQDLLLQIDSSVHGTGRGGTSGMGDKVEVFQYDNSYQYTHSDRELMKVMEETRVIYLVG
jgi:hypothetical protein